MLSSLIRPAFNLLELFHLSNTPILLMILSYSLFTKTAFCSNIFNKSGNRVSFRDNRSIYNGVLMPRPIKPKLIRCEPKSLYFKPRGIPVSMLEETVISLDELEALRLVDMEGMYQEEAAKMMAVSRQTVQQMLSRARAKVADALVSGKALKIEGGNYILKEHVKGFRCRRCGKSKDIRNCDFSPDENCPYFDVEGI